ncbi:hypothetical protein [Hydrogenophaga sp. BPS33]|uniref:hypothetical protein n=1 Tax=Hydrogenophaga sp. BPS33 TaxID=2651974 RepID=UPI00131FD206|nr:hypothetical protein [Hydrogenophaga sp. BPS33]QHE88057.1 hypothetical protein F9K07_25765 [Hydrogenophaga sp. BPS33]
MSSRMSDYLRFSNLQIAADTQAQAFIADRWQVVEHTNSTTTSFSGTLFHNSKTGEQVLSFRSTELADNLGDHLATNFNLLYPDAVAATYTFNGAGMGTVVVTQAINVFREHEEDIHA